MAVAVIADEQTNLLLNIREDPIEVELNSAIRNLNNNNCIKSTIVPKSGKFKSRARLCCSHLLPSRHRCCLHITSLLQIFCALTLLITVPKYGQISVQAGSDNFSALFFVMATTTSALVLLIALRKFWDPSFNIYSKLAIRSIFKYSLFFIISLLGISYCCEIDRVPCHLQDGLFFLSIPFSIVFMSIKKRRDKVNNKTKLIVVLSSLMALIFISTVPMLAYRYSCRGHDILTNQVSELGTVQSLWVLTYVISIGVFSFSLCGFWFLIQEQEDSCSRSLEWTGWFHLFAFTALICLFWTNLVPNVGVASGIDEFFSKLSGVWNCHFSSECLAASKLGFLSSFIWLVFLYLSNLLVYRFQSNPVFIVCNACLAIPLLSVFYSLFYFDQSGVHTHSNLSLGCLITMVLFPIAYVVLSCYHRASAVFNLLDTFDIY